nr:GNAT family N-acetyltransferase [uncultured Shinella sp.]
MSDFPVRFLPPRIDVAGIALRHAVPSDVAFFLELYQSFRMEELAAVPWPPEQKDVFLRQQFSFQHRHYLGSFPNADFLVVACDRVPIGRLYLDCTPDRWHVIDIGFLPEHRGRGLGTALLSAIQHEAVVAGAARVVLHVEQHNFRARALYRRLSFREVDDNGTHLRMEWPGRAVKAAAEPPAV